MATFNKTILTLIPAEESTGLSFTNPIAVMGPGFSGTATLSKLSTGIEAEIHTSGIMDKALQPVANIHTIKKVFDLSGKQVSHVGIITDIEYK